MPTSPTAATRSSKPSSPTSSTAPWHTCPRADSVPTAPGSCAQPSRITCFAPPGSSPVARRPSPVGPLCAARSSTSPPDWPAPHADPCCTYRRTGPGQTHGFACGTTPSENTHHRQPSPPDHLPKGPTRGRTGKTGQTSSYTLPITSTSPPPTPRQQPPVHRWIEAKPNTVQLRDRAVQYDGAAEWLGQARVGSSSVGFGVGRVADQGFPSGCCRCGGRRSWADGATAAGVAGAGGDLFFDWDGAAFRGLLRGRVRATHRWSVVDDGMGAVVVSADEIGYLSGTFTIGVRTAT